jgi:hypothetical protein
LTDTSATPCRSRRSGSCGRSSPVPLAEKASHVVDMPCDRMTLAGGR